MQWDVRVMTNNTVAHSEIDALIAGIRTCRDEAINEPATARAEIAALTEDRRSWRAVAERLEGEKQALRAQVERLTTVTEDDVEAKWMALKQRVCADPVKAVRCVMVTRADFRAALMAHTARGE